MNEENIDLRDNSISDTDAGKVTGGKSQGIGDNSVSCPKCGKYSNVHKTGNTKTTFFGLLKMYEWHCGICGHNFWESADRNND